MIYRLVIFLVLFVLMFVGGTLYFADGDWDPMVFWLSLVVTFVLVLGIKEP